MELIIKTAFASTFFFLVQFGFSQTDTSDYNLPPNVVLTKKYDHKEIDLSRALNELEHQYIAPSDYIVNAKFIKEGLTDEDWSILRKYKPEEFKYYKNAHDYYNQLSKRVKTILTTQELWNIYMFKSDLKEKLLQY